jgi:hypothetical protein
MIYGNAIIQFLTASELTIASDAITITQANHKLQPQSGTADNLSTINGTTQGQFGVLYASDFGTDTITIKHAVGNIRCVGAADITLSQGCVFWYSNGTVVFCAGGGGGATWGGITGTLSSQTDLQSALDAASVYPPGHLKGLTLSNNATDATNDIDIATGSCIDSADAANMVLASALTKRLDAAWAVGTGNGGLDTGSIANATYHVWLIKRPDTGVVDALFSTSASAPTMPTNYTLKRRIGSIVRTGGAIKAFVQDGDEFIWKVPVQDAAAANPGTAAVTRTLTLPTGIRVKAKIAAAGYGSSAAAAPGAIFISDLSITDTAAFNTAFNLYDYTSAVGENLVGGMVEVFTNTSAQVRSRVQISAAGTTLFIVTHGWVDTRGRM